MTPTVPPTGTPTVEIKQLLIPPKKWWWVLLVASVTAGVIGYFLVEQLPFVYRTQTTLMVGRAIDNPNPSSNELGLTQQLANTYADIAQRNVVKQGVMQTLGLTWLPDYSVRVIPNTQLIEITVVDTNPVRAQAVANELANQLILQTPTGANPFQEQRQTFINQQLVELESDIQATKEEIERQQTQLAEMFSARQIADTQANIQALQSKLRALQANYAALLANTDKGAINTISVIEEANLPRRPVGPNRTAAIILATLVGFFLATGVAYLLDYLDDSIKNPEEVREVLGMTTLGVIPLVNGKHSAVDIELIVQQEIQSPAKEAYRVLRTNLQFAAVDSPIKTLMITSPGPGEGKSTTVANLAIAYAQAGKRVIIVDADLHRPRQHAIFGQANNIGLTTALLQEHPTIESLLKMTEVLSLALLTSGPLPPNSSELLGTERMKQLLNLLANAADIVLLDSPPVTLLSDAAILSTLTDGVLLVIESGKTDREVAQRAIEALRQVNARTVGIVLNRLPSKGSGYYYYYHYHSHYYDKPRQGWRSLFRQ